MRTLMNRAAMVAMMAGALTLGGCATVDSVKHAQETADAALSQAQMANAAAQKAQATADQAGGDVKTVDAKVDHFIDEERAENKVEHKRHHHHRRFEMQH